MTTQKEITAEQTAEQAFAVWIPSLKRGAPSNAAGMRGAWTPYGTRAAALQHEHWANQAPWAGARQVVITDRVGSLTTDADLVCGRVLDDHETHGTLLGGAHVLAAKLIAAGRRVEGFRALLGV